MTSRSCGIFSRWRLTNPTQRRRRRIGAWPNISSAGVDRGISGSSPNRTATSSDELAVPYGDEDSPKVSIGVTPYARGQGVGEKLMRALIDEAARRVLGLCLSV